MVSVNYNGTEYYYLRNGQGDIVKLIDGTGATVVEYTYKTTGRQTNVTGSMASVLGSYQPFRWRGYVLDPEWGIYYLNSRYYDPNSARFLSPDTYLSTGQGVLGYNAYAYCLDNPVNMRDNNGFASTELPEVPTLIEIKDYYSNDDAFIKGIKSINSSVRFSKGTWLTSDLDARIELLNDYMACVSEIMGIKNKPQLVLYNGNNYKGQYIPESDILILSDYFLIYALNGDTYERALGTIIHECRHAYQNQYIHLNPSSFLSMFMEYDEQRLKKDYGDSIPQSKLRTMLAEQDAYRFQHYFYR